MSRRAWLTPENAPTVNNCWRVFVPDGIDFEACFRGAMLLLQHERSWEQYGSLTPAEVALIWEQANELTFAMQPCQTGGATMPIGTVLYGAYSAAPDGFLLCDGASYLQSEYEDLYAIIGTTWGGDATHFSVPDLRDRVAVGKSSTIALGATGGAKTHTLTIAEMPSHRHDFKGVTQAGASGVEIAPWSYTGGTNVSVVQPNGGGEAHNNMQPYAGLTPIIAYQ